MSVRVWKRVITLFVLVTIISLAAAVVSSVVKTSRLEDALYVEINDENNVDLSQYGVADVSEVENLMQFFGVAGKTQSMDYQQKYTDLYVENDFVYEDSGDEKICYLTFDDGPDAENTAKILDVLKKYDAKATFFVIYRDYKEERELYKRIVAEGHTIGIHTASHNYNKIYASVDAYLDDFRRCSKQVEDTTGVKPEIFRFPGGSVNSYNGAIYQEIIAEMTRRGYTYYDWNVSSGDAGSSYVSSMKITNTVLTSMQDRPGRVVLMHDGIGHAATADALEGIIKGLLERGYKLEALTKEVKPVQFGYGE